MLISMCYAIFCHIANAIQIKHSLNQRADKKGYHQNCILKQTENSKIKIKKKKKKKNEKKKKHSSTVLLIKQVKTETQYCNFFSIMERICLTFSTSGQRKDVLCTKDVNLLPVYLKTTLSMSRQVEIRIMQKLTITAV